MKMLLLLFFAFLYKVLAKARSYPFLCERLNQVSNRKLKNENFGRHIAEFEVFSQPQSTQKNIYFGTNNFPWSSTPGLKVKQSNLFLEETSV